MKLHTRIFAILCVVLGLGFAGCTGADTHEKIVDDTIKQMDRMAVTMGTITDKATAEKAMAELSSVVEEIKKIGARAKALGDPSADVQKKLEEKMKAKTQELQTKLTGAMVSMAKAGPEAAAIVAKGMQEFGAAMQEAGKAFGAK
jgi:hypothetical protein